MEATASEEVVDVKALIRDIPDFPKPGILFKDITPVLADAEALATVIDALAGLARVHGVDCVVGIESRGFILGAPVAVALGVPFVPARKPGKLPAEKRRVEYALEYGVDALEVHADALQPGMRVAVVDDLLATGGTAEAACRLVEAAGAEVAVVLAFIELVALGGIARLAPRPAHCLIRF